MLYQRSDATSHPENSSLPKCRRVGSINHEGTTVSVHLIPGTTELHVHDKSSLPASSPVLEGNNQVTSASLQACPVSKEPLMHHVADLFSPAPVGDSTHQMSNVSGHSQTHDSPRSVIPSFSLGLTQEIDAPNHGEDEEMGDNETEPGLATYSYIIIITQPDMTKQLVVCCEKVAVYGP
ncbi:hypothetical protein F2Q69_00024423 [Brassica cretica]|uniref:Uncharacterized protein n=1 Tax=Brassica cretica TaxID=69181 RepID=A0A8S9QI56_BRACR|nr:hypothetical protein F2Q69_00024423 [Brassica cretica]